MSAAANATSTCHAALSAARASAANNSALALLLYSACSRAGGAATYFEHAWLPEPPQCTSATRFGPDGEGGKVVCDAGNRRHGLANRNGCLVVSVGLNDDTRAEQAIFRSHPHCLIEGYDGTLTAAKRRLLPPEGLVHIPHNFNASTYKRYEGRTVSLLKIDCEASHAPCAASAPVGVLILFMQRSHISLTPCSLSDGMLSPSARGVRVCARVHGRGASSSYLRHGSIVCAPSRSPSRSTAALACDTPSGPRTSDSRRRTRCCCA